MNMDWWRRYVEDVLAEPDPDIFDEGVMRPDPPTEDPHVRVARASAGLRAAQDEWARAVAGLPGRRLDQ